jgi:hypothetical protein
VRRIEELRRAVDAATEAGDVELLDLLAAHVRRLERSPSAAAARVAFVRSDGSRWTFGQPARRGGRVASPTAPGRAAPTRNRAAMVRDVAAITRALVAATPVRPRAAEAARGRAAGADLDYDDEDIDNAQPWYWS